MHSLSKSLAILIFALSFSGLAAESNAPAEYRIIPIDRASLDTNNHTLTVGGLVPCGTALAGTNMMALQNTLYVAYIVRVDSIMCTGMPKYTESTISDINTTEIYYANPMPLNWGGEKVRLIEPTDLRTVSMLPGGPKSVQILFENQCGTTLGPIVKSNDKNGVEVGMIERPNPRMKKQDCEYSQEVRNLDGIRMSGFKHYSIYKTFKTDLSRSHELNIRPISRMTDGTAANKVSAHFQRQCNEAPVGLIVGEPRKTAKGTSVPYGILVAKFLNYDCGSTAMINDVYQIDAMKDKSWRMVSFNESENLKISPPTQFSPGAKNKAGMSGYSFDYLASCSKVVGVVYSNDWQGNLAVAVVHRPTDALETCTKSAKEVSLFQPYISTNREREIYPLRVRGS